MNDNINDGTAGHSKGNWSETRHTSPSHRLTAQQALDEQHANRALTNLAQHAPHDCGDPECPGVVNKRKLELYNKFQTAINEFAKAGLLT